MIRVAVAARSSVVRAGLESVVRSSSALELAAEFEADVLLLDSGSVPLEDVSQPAVLLTDLSDYSLVNAALRSGIRGVLSRDATPEEIQSAIQAVHAGLVVIAPGWLDHVLPEMRPATEALAEALSDRELEVLNLIAEGQSNKLIAVALGISEHTVKTHVASILAKLGAASRTEAVSQAIRRGLVML